MKNATVLRGALAFSMTLGFSGTGRAGQSGENPAPAKPATEAGAAQSQQPAAQPKAEFSSKDVEPTFKVRVNLVQVKVVVRDEKGAVVKDLRREDFQIYDQGKLQMITAFAVETPETLRKRAEEADKTQMETGGPGTEKPKLPQRYVAMVFDDVHMEVGDILPVRSGAQRLIDTLGANDRLAIYSTSGQMTQDFTGDKDALKKALQALAPRSIVGNSGSTCPEVSYYMADQVLNQNNAEVLKTLRVEVLDCQFKHDPRLAGAAQAVAESLLRQQLNAGNADNEASYRQLEGVLREISKKPGERVMILVSPGFLLANLYSEENGIVERANRAGVPINCLDARGLFSPGSSGHDISRPASDTLVTSDYTSMYRMQAQIEADSVLRDVSESTGGIFFHNSNDLAGGMQQLAGTPEVSYLLGYSPSNEKMDGKYHLVKVGLPEHRKYEVQARHGYYAPKKLEDPAEQANQEIQEAVFSQDEIQDLTLDFHTQYFKTDEANAQLSVVSRIDVKGMRFRKADDRRVDNLTVATVIFDENGGYVTGGQKFLELRLTDPTYERMSRNGLQLKSAFALKPGTYMVRQVVREEQGAQMAAKNGAVVIP